VAKKSPIPNGGDGYKRDARGRFGAGNRGGPGNPLCGLVNELRAKALTRMKKRRAVQRAVDKLLASVDGEVELEATQLMAIREILNRAGVSAESIREDRRVDVDERIAEKLEEYDHE
jgi:hypothetical protein